MSATGELITFIDSYLALDPFLFQPDSFWEKPEFGRTFSFISVCFYFPALDENIQNDDDENTE